MKPFLIIIALISLFGLWIHSPVQAQEPKQEVEKSISKHEMPASSLSLLDTFWKDYEKVHFYHETDGEKISYEAKIIWNDYQYSIEFNPDGSLIDIEQLISFDKIPEASKNTITTEITKQFARFKIRRVQRQFSGTESKKWIPEIQTGNYTSPKIRYEIEIDAENKIQMGSFEMTFDETGKLIHQRRIIRRSLDNIW